MPPRSYALILRPYSRNNEVSLTHGFVPLLIYSHSQLERRPLGLILSST